MTRPRDLETVVFYFARTSAAYETVLRKELAASGLDAHLRPGMGNVLFALFESDGVTSTEICQRLGVAKSTMTGVVARMVDSGVITADRDPSDSRAKRLYLTELGRSLEPRCREVTERLNQVFAADLRDDEQKQLLTQLQALLARLTAASER